MKTIATVGATPSLQRHWDIRAACNFMGGGTGTGLILGAAAAALSGQTFIPALILGLASIAFGLTMVLLEIGRPWRAFNVFFHPQTSWMTREGVLAVPLFTAGAAALALEWFGGPAPLVIGLMVLTGLTACGFLYCQARMLRGAKGIPAWREQTLTPFLLSTGLAEGAGLLAVLAALHLAPAWTAVAALGLAGLRLAAWQTYRQTLAAKGAPAASLTALDRAHPWFLILGHGVAATLLVLAILWPAAGALALPGGLLLAGSGWLVKLTIVTRAAATRGLTIPRTPVRGRGTSRLVEKPDWMKKAA